MKPSLLVSLLLLSFLLHKAQGIRLEKGFMKVDHQNIHEEKSSLIERNNGGVGEVILSKEEHCTGMKRKLNTVTTSTSTTTTTSKNEKTIEGNKANTISKGRSSSNGEMSGEHEKFTVNPSPPTSDQHQEVNHDSYVEITDLTEMDYSPARRKPPIHN